MKFKQTRIGNQNIALILFWSAGMVGNLLNWMFNIVTTRTLTVAEYGTLTFFLTIQFLASIPAIAIQTTINKYGAYGELKLQIGKSYQLTWWSAVCLMLGYLVLFPLISDFFQLPKSLSLHLISGSIFLWFFPLAWLRGWINAREAYLWSSTVLLSEGVTKLIVGIASRWQAPLQIAVLAIPFSMAVSLSLASYAKNRLKLDVHKDTFAEKTANMKVFWVNAMIWGLGVMLLYNLDVLLVKHYFLPEIAGIYAQLALLGKAIFFFSYSIFGLMIPILSAKVATRQPVRQTLSLLMGLTLAISVGITLIFCVFPIWSVKMFLGESYINVLPYLWQYCLAISILSLAATLATYHLILENYLMPIWLLMAAVAEMVGIMLFHRDLSQVVMVLLITIIVFTSTMFASHIFGWSYRIKNFSSDE